MLGRIRERLRQFAERELKRDPKTLKKVVSIAVVYGNPAAEILRKAEEMNADVVILGTHGKGVISHAFLGSVSEQVLHRIRKPVYIIPLPEGKTDITLGEI
jgi:nucleotide-binding universal stress UspA family protein